MAIKECKVLLYGNVVCTNGEKYHNVKVYNRSRFKMKRLP